MNYRGLRIRRVLGTCLSALMLALSVAVPLLERADLGKVAAAESQHDPATCAPGHNHTLCTLVGASHSLPSRQNIRVAVFRSLGTGVAGNLGTVFVPRRVDGHPTRAPPSV